MQMQNAIPRTLVVRQPHVSESISVPTHQNAMPSSVDRVVHHPTVLATTGGSYRLKAV